MTKEYVGKIWQRKVRLILAVIVFIALFGLSFHYLYDGINKRFIIFSMLSFLTGALIVCPRVEKWYLSAPLILLYLVMVPQKLFQRIELPVHDMSRIQDGAELANIFIIFLIYAIVLLISQKVSIALGGGGIILLIAFIVNYYVNQFRGTSLTITDLMATGTAMTVLDNYQLTMSSELWYSILYFCFFIALGFWCKVPGKGIKYHISVTVVSLSYFLFFYCFWDVSDYLEEHNLQGFYWNMSENERLNGFLLSFGISMKEMSMEKPWGYSENTLAEIAEETGETYEAPQGIREGTPNIIIIMHEAWSDLRVLGNLETSEPYMPFVDSLSENTVKGNTHVQILGGLTANSEFEVLTGDSLAFFAPSVIPYQLQVNHDMYSLARVLGDQGYQTMAMHPAGEAAWNRGNVYEHFGFEEFVDMNKFHTELEFLGVFITDRTNFKEIIWQYENRDKDKPFFLFNVTIQNHADYYGQVDTDISIEKVGDVPKEELDYIYDAETYINLMKATDDDIKYLFDYFESVDEPTIICMFGDHQPYLSEGFYNAMFANSGLTEEEQTAIKYITPYVIWANYDVEFPEYGDMSANYLGAAVLECAGVELPDYYKYLLQLQKEHPVVTRFTIEDIKKEESIEKYQMLEYNHLIEEDYITDIFSAVQ